MDPDIVRCVRTVRLLALRARSAAGGPPRLAELARALEPPAKLVAAAANVRSARDRTVVKENVIDGEWRGYRT